MIYHKICANPACEIPFTTTKINVKYHNDSCREIVRSIKKVSYNRWRNKNNPDYILSQEKNLIKKRDAAKKEKQMIDALEAAKNLKKRGRLLISTPRMEARG